MRSRTKHYISGYIKKVISVYLSFALTFGDFAIALAESINISSESSSQNVHLEKAANNVSVLNIASPNASGLSNNQFDKFNVNREGLIINNSASNGSTTLGGQVLANPNLKSGNTARIILTQVTSRNSSTIDGSIEIAGSKAAFILANPNGINVNGAQFINASGVTLTTGVPTLSKLGELEKLTISEGNVEISGADLNLEGLDHFEIIAKTAKLATKIHTKKTKIVTGENEYNPKTYEVTKKSTKSPSSGLAIDSSSLGGLYAGKISIISTEEGVGVNLPNMGKSEDIEITADGNINLQNIAVSGKVNVTSVTGEISLADKRKIISSSGSATFTAKGKLKIGEDAKIGSRNKKVSISSGSLENLGNILTPSIIELKVKDDIFNSGRMIGSDIILTTGGNILNSGILASTTGNVILNSAGSLSSSGYITTSQNLNFNIGQNLTNSGLISSLGTSNYTIKGGVLNKDKGIIESKSSLKITAANIQNLKTSVLQTTEDFTITATSGDLINLGDIFSTGILEINNNGNSINNGKIITGNSLIITTNSIFQNSGSITSLGEARLLADNFVNKDKGIIESYGNLFIKAAKIRNSQNSTIQTIIDSTNPQLAKPLLELQGNIINEGSSTISAADNFIIEGNSLVNTTTSVIAAELELTTNVKDLLNEATIATFKFNNNASGEFKNTGEIFVGSGGITAENLLDYINSGKFITHGNFVLKAKGSIENTEAGQIITLGKNHNFISGNFTNTGSIAIETGHFSIDSASKLFNSGSIIVSQGDLITEAKEQVTHNIATAKNRVTVNSAEGGIEVLTGGKIISENGIINLLANKKAIKINSNAAIGSKTQDVHFTSNSLENLGIIVSAKALGLKINNDLINKGSIYGGSILVEGNNKANLENSGLIFAKESDLAFKGIRELTNKGTIFSSKTLEINTEENLSNNGRITSLQTAKIFNKGDFVNHDGGIMESEKSLKITSANVRNLGNSIIHTTGDLAITASSGNIDNAQGSIIQSSISAATPSSEGKMTLISSGEVINEEGSKIIASGSLTSTSTSIKNLTSSTISSNDVLSLNAKNFANESQIQALKFSNLITGEFENSGEINIGSGGIIAENVTNFTNNGIFQSQGEIILSAAEKIENSGVITAENGALTLNSMSDLINYGLIETKNGHLTAKSSTGEIKSLLSTPTSDKRLAGVFSAKGGILTLKGSRVVNQNIFKGEQGLKITSFEDFIVEPQARLAALGNIEINSPTLTNEGIIISTRGNLLLTDLTGNFKNSSSGKIFIKEGINGLIGGNLINEQGGEITILDRFQVTDIGGSLINKGSFEAKGGIENVKIGANFTNDGSFIAENSSSINVTGTTTNSSIMSFNGTTNLNSGPITNDGEIYLGQDSTTTITSSGDISSKKLYSQGNLAIQTNGKVTNHEEMLASGNLSVNGAAEETSKVTNFINNGKIQAGKKLTIQSLSKISSLAETSKITGGEELSLIADEIENKGKIFGGKLTAQISKKLANAGEIGAGSSLLIETITPVAAGAGSSAVTLNSILENSGKITSKGSLIAKVGTINQTRAEAVIFGTGPTELNATKSITQNGLIRSGSTLKLTTNQFDFTRGSFTTADGTLTLTTDLFKVESGSEFSSKGDIELFTSGVVTNYGVINSGGSLTINGKKSVSNYGSLFAGRNMTIRSSSFTNSHLTLANGNMDFAGVGDTKTGSFYNTGTVESFGGGDIKVKTGSFYNGQGGRSAIRLAHSQDEMYRGNTYEHGEWDGKKHPGYRRVYEEAQRLLKTDILKTEENFVSVNDPYLTIKRVDLDGNTFFYYEEDTISSGFQPATLATTANINIEATSATNENSYIYAGKDLTINGSTLTNKSDTLYKRGFTAIERVVLWGGCKQTGTFQRYYYQEIHPHTRVLGNVPSSIIARGRIIGSISGEANIGSATLMGHALSTPKANSAKDVDAINDELGAVAKAPLFAAPTLTDEAFEKTIIGTVKHDIATTGGAKGAAARAAALTIAPVAPDIFAVPRLARADDEAVAASRVARGIAVTEEAPSALLSAQTTLLGARSPETSAIAKITNLASNSRSLIDGKDLASLEPTSQSHVIKASQLLDNLTFDELDEVTPPAPGDLFKVETNPQLTEASKYYGSQDFVTRVQNLDLENTPTSSMSSYLYNKLLRDQMIMLSGNHSLVETTDLIAHLQTNSNKEATRLELRPGIALSSEQVAQLRENIVWDQQVVIDGEKISVPRVYLAGKHEVTSGLFADTIDLTAGSITNDSSIKARRINLTSAGDVRNIRGGIISSSEHLRIAAGGDIKNISSTISGDGSASLSATNIRNETGFSRHFTHGGYYDSAYQTAIIDFKGDVTTRTTGDQIHIGSVFNTGNRDVAAGGDLLFAPLALESSYFSGRKGFRGIGGDNYDSSYSLTHQGTNSVASGSSIMRAGGDIAMIGSSLSVTGDSRIAAGGTVTIAAATDVTHNESERHWTKSGIFSDTDYSSHHVFHDERLIGGKLNAGGRSVIESGVATSLKAADIAAGNITEFIGGAVEFGSLTTDHASFRTSSKESMFTEHHKGFGHTESRVNPTQLTGQVDLTRVTSGSRIDLTSHTPVPNWAEGLIAQGRLTAADVSDSYNSINYNNFSLTPEFSIVIAIGATVLTAGTASTLAAGMVGMTTAATSTAAAAAATATTSQLMAASAITAGLTTTASQFAVNIANSQGDIGEAAGRIKARSILESAALAGVTAGINQSFQAGANASVAQKAAITGLRIGAKTATTAAITGAGPESALRSAVIGEATDFIFENIGDFAADNTMADGSPGKIAMHAVAGGAIAEVTGGDFASGAIAAGITEALSPAIDNLAAKETRTKAAGLTGALTSFAMGADAATISANAAITESARANNRELHSKERQVLLAATKGKSPEEQQRYIKAARALTHSSDGVPLSDEHKAMLAAGDLEGSHYIAEQQELRRIAKEDFGYQDAFVYSNWDRISDTVSREADWLIAKGRDTFNLATGTLGAAGLAITSYGATVTGNIPGAIYAGGLGVTSYGQAVEASEQLFGGYRSSVGERVVRSYASDSGADYLGRISKDVATEVVLGAIVAKGAMVGAKTADKGVSSLLTTRADKAAVTAETSAIIGETRAVTTEAQAIKPPTPGRTAAGADAPATAAEVKAAGGAGEVKPVKLRGAANPKVLEAIQRGMEKHKEFKAKVQKKDERWNATPSKLDPSSGKIVKPDALTPSGKPIELKPNTASGRRQGAKQIKKYENVYKEKGKVIYYDP